MEMTEFIGMPGQKDEDIALNMLSGLERMVNFFRYFFSPERQLVLFSVGHSIEMDALANFLAKENGKAQDGRFSFLFV